MKKLRKKSIKTTLPLFILFAIVGGLMLGFSIPSLLTAKKDPIPLEDVDFSGDIDGLYVTGTIYGIYDYYCETTKGNTIESREYLIDADDYYYMGMIVQKSDMEPAEALMEVSWDYLDGLATEEELQKVQYEITGTISPIPTDSLHYYNEYRDYVVAMDPASAPLFLPYYIEVNKAGNFTVVGAWMLTIAGTIFVGLGILFLTLAVSGAYQKAIKKYIANSASPEMTAERIERFLENTPEVNGLYFNNEFVCGQHGSTTVFGETPKIVWIYMHVTKHKRYFITVGKTYEMVMCFVDGTRHFVSMKNEPSTEHTMKSLSEICPQAILGYTDELNRLFSRSLSEFLNLRYNPHNMDPDIARIMEYK